MCGRCLTEGMFMPSKFLPKSSPAVANDVNNSLRWCSLQTIDPNTIIRYAKLRYFSLNINTTACLLVPDVNQSFTDYIKLIEYFTKLNNYDLFIIDATSEQTTEAIINKTRLFMSNLYLIRPSLVSCDIFLISHGSVGIELSNTALFIKSVVFTSHCLDTALDTNNTALITKTPSGSIDIDLPLQHSDDIYTHNGAMYIPYDLYKAPIYRDYIDEIHARIHSYFNT